MTHTPSPESPRAPVVSVRRRHDGWTPDRQEAFLCALAQSGCVTHAAKAVGKSAASAYALKQRPDAKPFRMAWEAATDMAISRLADATLSRAIHGVAEPVFYKGEVVGERTRYNDRLAMFLLRTRDVPRHGRWIDTGWPEEITPDGSAIIFARMMNLLSDWLFDAEPFPDHRPGENEEEDDDWLEEEVPPEPTPAPEGAQAPPPLQYTGAASSSEPAVLQQDETRALPWERMDVGQGLGSFDAPALPDPPPRLRIRFP